VQLNDHQQMLHHRARGSLIPPADGSPRREANRSNAVSTPVLRCHSDGQRRIASACSRPVRVLLVRYVVDIGPRRRTAALCTPIPAAATASSARREPPAAARRRAARLPAEKEHRLLGSATAARYHCEHERADASGGS